MIRILSMSVRLGMIVIFFQPIAKLLAFRAGSPMEQAESFVRRYNSLPCSAVGYLGLVLRHTANKESAPLWDSTIVLIDSTAQCLLRNARRECALYVLTCSGSDIGPRRLFGTKTRTRPEGLTMRDSSLQNRLRRITCSRTSDAIATSNCDFSNGIFSRVPRDIGIPSADKRFTAYSDCSSPYSLVKPRSRKSRRMLPLPQPTSTIDSSGSTIS